MKKYQLLILALFFLLAGCKEVAEEEPVEFPVYSFTYSPAVKQILPGIYACAAEFPDVIFSPKENYYSGEGLSIRLGEPKLLPEYVYALAYDELVLVTHPQNPVTEWTDFRIINILNGRINNWDYLGGSGDIEIWLPAEDDETRYLLDLHILDNNPVTPAAHTNFDLHEIYEIISNTPLAISFLPASFLGEGVSINSLGISLPVLALSDSELDQVQQDFLACLQGETGQNELQEIYELLP